MKTADDQFARTKVVLRLRRPLVRALAEGALKPRIDSVYALEDCADAHKRVEAGDKIGSVIVTPA